jgi:hypothetical protein
LRQREEEFIYTAYSDHENNWSVKAGDQVQTLVQLLPLTESGL